VDTADQLTRLLGPLRRAALGRTRARAKVPDLPDAQIELLRTLSDHGPLGTGEAAERLRVAPSTVSNLVRTMTEQGLITRRVSPTDLRATSLAASTRALALLRRYDEAGGSVIREALDTLPPGRRKQLDEAMPALAELLAALTAGE
jgi:DNA-binding MarR family transcriptional regulator